MLQKGEINLLPPSVLKVRAWRLVRKRANRIFGAVVVGGVIVAVTYGTIWWVLARVHADFTGEIAVTAVNSEEVQKRVRGENALLRTVVERVEAYPRWTPLAGEVLSAAPREIDITEMRLFTQQGAEVQAPDTLVIAGESVSRAAIVEYESRLKELEWVQEVKAPLANLASGESVSFSFTLVRMEGLPVLPDVPEAQGELEEDPEVDA